MGEQSSFNPVFLSDWGWVFGCFGVLGGNASPRIRVAAIVRKGDSILLVRHEKNAASYWLLPGGGVEFGETLEQALQREMREETCLEVRVGELCLACDSIAPDGSRHLVSLCFAAEVVSGEAALGEDERVAEVRYVDRDALGELTLHPDLGEELRRGFSEGFDQPPIYVGSRWTEGV